jgi:hypothetical protein
MATEKTTLPQMPVPCCPHCGVELPSLGLYNWATGVFMILAIFCPGCKKVLNFQALPMEIGEPSRISMPS